MRNVRNRKSDFGASIVVSLASSSRDRPNLTLSRMIKWSWRWRRRREYSFELTCNNWIFHPQLMASIPLFGQRGWLSKRGRQPHGLRPFGGPDHLKAIPLLTKDHERRRGHPQRNNFQHWKGKIENEKFRHNWTGKLK